MQKGTVVSFAKGVGQIRTDSGGRIQLHVSAWRGFSGSRDPELEWPKPGDRVKFEGGDVVSRCWPLDEDAR